MTDPRYIHRILIIDDETMDARQRRRYMVAADMANLLEYVLQGFIKRQKPSPGLWEWEKFQRSHITQHMRKPQNMALAEVERLTGGKIDRLALQCCNVVRAWEHLLTIYDSKAYRKHRERQHQAERQQKLERRRAREQERLQGTVARVQTKQKGEHEEVERCSKCHKRPAVKDHLCQPCYDWESAKLGRE